MTRVRLIVTVDMYDDLDDVQDVIDSIWNNAIDIVDVTLLDEGDQ